MLDDKEKTNKKNIEDRNILLKTAVDYRRV